MKIKPEVTEIIDGVYGGGRLRRCRGSRSRIGDVVAGASVVDRPTVGFRFCGVDLDGAGCAWILELFFLTAFFRSSFLIHDF
ncbi:hypothetical protein RYX36_033370 [Vicia faba]